MSSTNATSATFGSHKIELKSIQFNARLSEETHCFSATLYIDGVKRGTVGNRGEGGPHTFSDRAAEDFFDKLGKSLPPKEVNTYGPDKSVLKSYTLPYNAELIISKMVNGWLVERDCAKALKKKILFVKEEALYSMKADFARAPLEQHVKAVASVHPGCPILNTMPFADAVAAYKKYTR